MTRWLVVVALLAFGIVGGAYAQELRPLPCEQRLECQQQRVLDLKDYREWLEGQIAMAKALLNDTRRALGQKEAELAACRAAPQPGPTVK